MMNNNINVDNINEIIKTYTKLYKSDIELLFDRSPNCDSSVISGYLSMLGSEKQYLNIFWLHRQEFNKKNKKVLRN